jgi:hypothetical protein
VLTLLVDVATDRPLLCVVDDAQWVDEESTATLTAVARRLHADSIGMLIAVREPSTRRVSVERLPTIDIMGLDREVSRRLVDAALDANAEGGLGSPNASSPSRTATPSGCWRWPLTSRSITLPITRRS